AELAGQASPSAPRSVGRQPVQCASRGGATREQSPEPIVGDGTREEAMSAKHKLNAAHCSGALLIAGLLGWVTGSLLVFLLALVALLVAGSHGGDIRR